MRTKEQIEAEYAQNAAHVGDKLFLLFQTYFPQMAKLHMEMESLIKNSNPEQVTKEK